MLSISHRLRVASTAQHALEIELTVRSPSPLPALTFFMPVWTPGSYLVREFARHVESLRATAGGAAAPAPKIRKNAWRVEPAGAREVTVSYRLWANEMTVRTNHVDATHAFVNGAATFLALEGHTDLPCTLDVDAPAGWRVATALGARGERTFEAASYDELVDAPLEIGTHDEEPFECLGKPHAIALWPAGRAAANDRAALARDTRAILECEAALFGGALPYDRYHVLLHLASRGRGGLEHASSAALVASDAAFASREGYLDLLALVAHEALHAWSVKRIRPAALTPYDYERESYTRLLWWFEGGTSYYDYLTLRRARLCSVTEYLEHLAGEIAYLDATPGRLVHSLEDASFDAWIKAYRPDESTQNTTVSYYRKGEVVCALLDLEIRARSGGRASLDDAMRALWREHGERGAPVAEDALEPLLARVAGAPLADLFDAFLRSTRELDYDAHLSHVGLRVERAPRAEVRASLGVRARVDAGRVTVSAVPRGGAAHRAGVDVGDELLALGGRRVESASLDAALAGRAPGDALDVIVCRDGRLLTLRAALDPPRAERVKLVPRDDPSPEARARFAAWLGAPHPAWEKK